MVARATFRHGFGAAVALVLAAVAPDGAAARTPVYVAEPVAAYPHDSRAFTQGLFWHDGWLYEGTGLEGRSTLRKVALETGDVLRSVPLDPDVFGEGIAMFGDRLFQLAWHGGSGFVWSLADFAPLGRFEYGGEGWGLTQDAHHLILSDGSARLRFLDPATGRTVRSIRVRADGCDVDQLNELEWIDGEIWANIWHSDLIARIDPETGKVRSFVDVASLGPVGADSEAVPNGIAHDPATGRIWVTGKLWPRLYQIRIAAKPARWRKRGAFGCRF